MPTSSSLCAARLLAVGALLLSSACDGNHAAPSGSWQEPAVADGEPSERADSGRTPVGGKHDAGAAEPDAGGEQPVDAGSRDTAEAGPEAGPVAEAGQVDARVDVPIERGELASVERVLVADGQKPAVHVLDGMAGSLLESITLTGQASVYAGPSGRLGYVLEAEANLVHVIDVGLLAAPNPVRHELTGPVRLLAPALQGLRPGGFSAQRSDRVLLFFADAAEVVSLRDADSAVQERLAMFSAGRPHPGFALGVGGEVLTTVVVDANSGAQLTRLDQGLQPLEQPAWTCSDPESGAISGSVAAVVCREGVLRYSPGGQSKLLAYPPRSGQGPAPSLRLVPHASDGSFLTVFEGRLCLLRDTFQCGSEPAGEVLDVSFDARGKRLISLTADGVLHWHERATLAPTGQLAPVAAPRTSATPASIRASLALGRQLLYVSDPEREQVQVIDPSSGDTVSSIRIPGGAPTMLAVFRYPD